MYWSKHSVRVTLLAGFTVMCFAACKPDIKETGAVVKYFDLKGFFTADTARLNKLNQPVLKTVMHNGLSETKEVKISNWGQELDLFSSSDINKPAWKNDYSVSGDSDMLIYKTRDPDLKMQEMIIKRDKKQVKWILIFNKTKNILYQTIEKLSYFPDSLYLIEKRQNVRLMGSNTYVIKGVIKK